MKMILSKKQDGVKRHVCVIMTEQEYLEIKHILFNQILKAQAQPVVERFRGQEGNIMVRWRCSLKYLEALMLTFPFADCSAALENRLNQQIKERLDAEPVPEMHIPGLRVELHDFQKKAVHRMHKYKYFVLDDEMGLGKTVQALARIMSRQAYPALAIVPNNVTIVWLRMIEEFTNLHGVIVQGTNAEREAILREPADIYITNIEGIRARFRDGRTKKGKYKSWYEPRVPGLFKKKFKMIVVDEYHRLKNPDAQATKGLHMLDAPQKLAMSGTPILNGRPEERWAILHWLWPERWPTEAEFRSRYLINKGSKVLAYQNLHEIKDFLKERSIRRRKEHVRDDLPEVVYADRFVPLSEEQRRIYDQIVEELLIYVEENPKRINNTLVQMTRLKQAAFSPELYDGSPHSSKLVELKSIVSELVENDEKAIIFTQWKRAAEIINRELAEYNPALVHGEIPQYIKKEDRYPRMEQVDRFNNDPECKIFIGTIGTCREGFTLSAATYVIFTDKDWVPANNQQAIARSAAGGLRGVNARTSHVHVIEIKASDTIEQYIDALLARKQRINDRVVEQDAGAIVERIEMSDLVSLMRKTRKGSRGKGQAA